MQPKKKSDDEIQTIVARAVEDAVDFITSEIAPQRNKAQEYFEGKVGIGHETGRSSVVATKCRDVVRSLKPAILRVFLQDDSPVEFVPSGPDNAAEAEQKTAYANYKFEQANGYRIFSDVVHDAMVKKAGIAKVFWDETETVDIEDYTGLSDEAFAYLVQQPNAEVIEHTATPVDMVDEMGVPVQAETHDAKIAFTNKQGDLRIESIPPEEFFVNATARNLEDAAERGVCGTRTEMTVSDLVSMGFEFAEVVELDSEDDQGSEDDTRRDNVDRDNDSTDDALKKVLVTECYMRVDIEGTGIARPYRFLCGGTKYKVLHRELCDDVPFAVFEVDPEPHTFFGRSTVELVLNDQDAATSILRGVLDNIALTNTPGSMVIDGQANIDDLLNNEIGKVVRVKSMGAVMPLEVPFTAGATLGALEYYDNVIDGKTGVTRASMGLDPNVLQGSTATAVVATMGAATGQAEIIARNLAEGGMKQLFKLILAVTRKNVSDETMMRVDGQFIPVTPSDWARGGDMAVNVGLGSGQRDTRLMALREALQAQTQAWQQGGPNNGLVTLTMMRNTFADILSIQGIKNVDRYFAPMNAETEQQMQQQASQQPPAPDPYLEGEKIKAQTKAQSDQQRAQVDIAKARMADDLERDKADADTLLKAADLLGKYGVHVDLDAIAQMQAAPRF